ncbi:hypothetical protein ACUN9Y_13325 [Halomonas sp. V046]|uniref:hypothetical protein n=1 Tax=Halomonas sp. V046 TaxID=3459611 RepID=UPI004044ACE9
MIGGLLAGGVAGGGKAVQTNALGELESRRRAALAKLEHDQAMVRQDDQQEFSRGERVAGEQYQSGRDETLQGYQQDNTRLTHDLSMQQERYRQGQQNYRTNRTISSREAEGSNDWQLVQTDDGYAQWSPSRNAYRDANLPDGAQMGGQELTSRDEIRIKDLQSRRELIANQLNGDIPPGPEEAESLNSQLGTINSQIDRLVGGQRTQSIDAEIDAALDDVTGPAPAGTGLLQQGMGADRTGDAESVAGMIQRADSDRENRQAEDSARQAATQARDAADDVLDRLEYEMAGNASSGGMMAGINTARGTAGRASEETLDEAASVAARLLESSKSEYVSEDQRRWISERIIRLRDMGVPIELEN